MRLILSQMAIRRCGEILPSNSLVIIYAAIRKTKKTSQCKVDEYSKYL